MEDMGPRPLYLQKHTTRHGKVAYYVRVKRGPLVRLNAEYGTDEFWDQYRAVLAGTPLPKAKPTSASLQWLYDRYKESQKWAALSLATRRQRENIFLHVMAKAGNEAYKSLDGAAIEAGLDDRRATPAQARNYLDAVKGLFRWAKKNDLIAVDPTLTVEAPERVRGGSGFHPWDEADLAAYRAKWPLGTRQRVWIEVLLGTGLRRGDAVVAGKQHIKAGVFSLKTEKTGMVMHCVIEPELQAALDAGPTGDLAFICGERGKPFVKEAFGGAFKTACKKAGLLQRSAHGVRKLAATLDAERGYTEREMEAKYGWTGGYMASLYTKTANRKRMVVEAARRTRVLPVRERVLPEKSDSKTKGLEAKKSGLVRSRKVAQ